MATSCVQSVVPDCRAVVVDLSAGPATVYTGPALLIGVYVNTVLSAHALPIMDDESAIFTLPASLAAGTFVPCHGARFSTSIIAAADDEATGNVTLLYAPAV